jgi:hypothetical protein
MIVADNIKSTSHKLTSAAQVYIIVPYMTSYKDRIFKEFGIIPKLPRGHTYKNVYSKLTEHHIETRLRAAVAYIVPIVVYQNSTDAPIPLLTELLEICQSKYEGLGQSQYEDKSNIEAMIGYIAESLPEIPRKIVFKWGATENLEMLSIVYNKYGDERSFNLWSDAIRGAARANNYGATKTLILELIGDVIDDDGLYGFVEDAALESASFYNIKILRLLYRDFADEMDSILENRGIKVGEDVEDNINNILQLTR